MTTTTIEAIDAYSASSEELVRIVKSMEIWTQDYKKALAAARRVEGVSCWECVEVATPCYPTYATKGDYYGVRRTKWNPIAYGPTWYCVAANAPTHPRWKVVREVGS